MVQYGFIEMMYWEKAGIVMDLENTFPVNYIVYNGKPYHFSVITMIPSSHQPHGVQVFGEPQVADAPLREALGAVLRRHAGCILEIEIRGSAGERSSQMLHVWVLM